MLVFLHKIASPGPISGRFFQNVNLVVHDTLQNSDLAVYHTLRNVDSSVYFAPQLLLERVQIGNLRIMYPMIFDNNMHFWPVFERALL